MSAGFPEVSRGRPATRGRPARSAASGGCPGSWCMEPAA